MIWPIKASGSQEYRQVVRGYLRLHQLEVEGRDESPEADLVRDSLDLPWQSLTDLEKERIQGLSADLFDLSEPATDVPQELPPQAKQDLTASSEAKQRGEWDLSLALLRRWKNQLPPSLLSYLRGNIWFEAGYPEVGALFFEHATRREMASID